MLSEKNNIRTYANEAKQTSDNNPAGLYISDTIWKNDDERKQGAKNGEIAQSASFNTALRQASYVATILGEAIAQRFNLDFGTDLDPDNITSASPDDRAAKWGTKFNKLNFLQEGEVTTTKLANASNSGTPTGITEAKIENNAITKTKIKDKEITAEKLSDNITKNDMTVGKAHKIKYTTVAPTEDNIDEDFLIIYAGSLPENTYRNIIYLITI